MQSESRKIVVDRAGGYERLRIERGPVPVAGKGQVRIDVKAIGVNFADIAVRMGLYASAKEYVGWPITPGFEVAGVIGAVGEGVEDVAVGDEVMALTRFGGYSTHVIVDRGYVFRKPDGMAVEQAAALPAVYMTAWFALFEMAHPRPGAVALVHSAAGGVGGALVQMLKIAGAKVVGVVGGSHKVERVKAAGADHVIDKSSGALWREAERIAPEGYDLILDANGVSTVGESYRHLRRAGKLVVYGFHSMMPKEGGRPSWARLAIDYVRTPRLSLFDMVQDSKSVLAFNLSYLFDRVELLREGLAQIGGWLAEGRMAPPGIVTYPLEDVARAHADLESGKTVGKLVLMP